MPNFNVPLSGGYNASMPMNGGGSLLNSGAGGGSGGLSNMQGWGQVGGGILQGIGAIGGFYNGMQQNKLAKQQMAMQEKYARFNADAMVDQYNTGLKMNQQELLGAQAAGSGTYQDMEGYMGENGLDKI